MLVTTFCGELEAPKSELPSFENRADDSPAPFPSDDDATVLPAWTEGLPLTQQPRTLISTGVLDRLSTLTI